MEALPLDHECPWRDEALALRVVVAEQRQQIERLGQALAEEQQKLAQLTLAVQSLERRFFGPKTEKMPSVMSELRRDRTKADAEAWT